MKSFFLGIFIFASIFSADGHAESRVKKTYPSMSGDISSPECIDAFNLATSMFKSNASRLYAPLSIPKTMKSALILGAPDIDISAGNALTVSPDLFEEDMDDANTRHIYWSKKVQRDKRIVVLDIPIGWRGDMYSLYLVNANEKQDKFLTNIQNPKNAISNYPALVENTWRPPLVFMQGQSQKLWFIVVGEPYQALSNWNVYKETKGEGFGQGCEITFQPQGRPPMASLPKTVQQFARLLDKTIGPGSDEGSLQQTARLRLEIEHVWANVAYRPWAISESDTYNSREEVEAGLVEWSKKGPLAYKIYSMILGIYSKAERDLGNYYAHEFSLSEKRADKLAEWVLDIAFRANYVFSTGGDYYRYDNVNTNPWKDLQ